MFKGFIFVFIKLELDGNLLKLVLRIVKQNVHGSTLKHGRKCKKKFAQQTLHDESNSNFPILGIFSLNLMIYQAKFPDLFPNSFYIFLPLFLSIFHNFFLSLYLSLCSCPVRSLLPFTFFSLFLFLSFYLLFPYSLCILLHFLHLTSYCLCLIFHYLSLILFISVLSLFFLFSLCPSFCLFFHRLSLPLSSLFLLYLSISFATSILSFFTNSFSLSLCIGTTISVTENVVEETLCWIVNCVSKASIP